MHVGESRRKLFSRSYSFSLNEITRVEVNAKEINYQTQ